MKTGNIVICVVLFMLGLFIGMFNGTVVEIPVEVEVRVPYLDLTDENLGKKLEGIANMLGKTFIEPNDIYSEGYRAGYRDGYND